LLPAFGVRRRYAAARDLSYGDHGRRNHLDIWRRADLPADAPAPVLVQVHGGAWTMGEKRGQAHPLMAHLAERGWVCVAINYRLSPRAHWPDHIVDVKRALAWTKANIADHGGDPSFVVITGGSAGGHLAALAALTPDLASFQPGFEDADTSVAAAVPFYGVYDFTNRDGSASRALVPFLERRVMRSALADDRAVWHEASPVSHVRPDAPPFFVLHGTNDVLVPVEQARSFVRCLRGASRNPVVYAELPRAQHAFDVLPSVRVHHTVRAVERFLAVVRSEHGGATPAEAVVSDRV
jgi:acetyl esterase/lipase